MFATVIPLLRTPPGVDAFDYRIPSGLSVKPGMLVVVPFRKRRVAGIVTSVMKHSDFAEKAAEISDLYAEIQFPEASVELLEWLSVTTFTSRPSVLKSWLRQLPQKPHPAGSDGALSSGRAKKTELKTHWTPDAREQLIEAARDANGRVLILTPWKHRVLELQEELGGGVLLSDMGVHDYFNAWSGFLNNQSGILISTRIGAWLSPVADIVLIDEPENDDHKQDDLSPRFDARRIAFWAEAREHSSLQSFGLTPPIHINETAPAIPAQTEPIVRHPKGRSDIPFIEAESLQRLRDHDGSLCVIHPILGTRSRLICSDCGWQAECSRCGFPVSAERRTSVCRLCKQKDALPLSCPECGAVDLSKSILGIEALKKQFAEKEPNLKIEWRTTNAAELEQPFAKNSCVLLTMGDLLGAGGSEDIRRNERLAVAYRRLAEQIRRAEATLLIQTNESHAHEWPRLLTPEGYETFRQEELAERKAFAYPPLTRLVKVIVSGSEAEALTWQKKLIRSAPDMGIQGPFPVAFLPKTRTPRYVFHLRPPENISEKKLIALLTPLAKSAIIDLDPIAFFR